MFASLAGVAVLSLVTWGGVSAGLRISRGFAFWSLLVPVLGAVLVVVQAHGWPGSVVIGGLRRHAGTLVLSLCVLLAVAIPLESAKVGLTSVSLGSCDAADYAAGGRLLRDFKRSDLDGFNGQTEVVALRSVDTFYGHWLRLNHFAPAGLIAWFSSLFGMEVTKLITVLGLVLHAAAVPLAFWA